MFKRRKKSSLGQLFSHSYFLFLLGFLILILISYPLFGSLKKQHSINQEVRLLEEEILKLEKENSDLEKLSQYLESNDFVEEKARLNLGLKKEGEEVVIIKNMLPSQSNIVSQDEKNIQVDLSNPQRWFFYFYN